MSYANKFPNPLMLFQSTHLALERDLTVPTSVQQPNVGCVTLGAPSLVAAVIKPHDCSGCARLCIRPLLSTSDAVDSTAPVGRVTLGAPPLVAAVTIPHDCTGCARLCIRPLLSTSDAVDPTTPIGRVTNPNTMCFVFDQIPYHASRVGLDL